MRRSDARSLAVEVVAASLKEALLFEDRLHRVQNRHRLPDAERRLLEEMAFGTMRRKLTLQHIVQHFLKRRLGKLEFRVQAALLVGAYQILLLHRVPAYAAVDETVETVKARVPDAAPFVNAVLRRTAEVVERKSTEHPMNTDPKRTLVAPEGFTLLKDPILPDPADRVKYFSIQFSVSEFIVEKLLKQFGKRVSERILKAAMTPPQFTFRTNRLKVSRSKLMGSLANSAVRVSRGRHPAAVRVKYSQDVRSLAQFRRGWFYVQDEGAMFVTDALGVRPGMDVLDVCAAPGGKTAAIGESLRGKGLLLGVDVNIKRLLKAKENLKRLACDAVFLCADGRSLKNTLNAHFDRILLDVPCSNTGVLRRRIDARYRLNQTTLNSLTELQDALLEGVAPLLRPKGILLYSTCSILREENEDRTERFLERHPEFSLQKSRLHKPRIKGQDGFFYAKLRRLESP